MKGLYLLLFLFSLLFSCKEESSNDSSQNKIKENQSNRESVAFQNRWILQQMGDTSFTEKEMLNHISVPRFKVDTVKSLIYGSLGCNGFSAKFKKEGNRIHFSDFFQNEVACPSLSLENHFSKLLLGSDSLHVIEDILILYSDSIKVRLKKLDLLPIENKEWVLQKIDDIKLGDLEEYEILRSNPSLKFDVFDREVEINLGCGIKLKRNLRIEKGRIFIEPLTIFPRPTNCDENWSIPFLEQITGDFHYTINDDKLRIKNRGGVYEFTKKIN
ncbi:META domain-containing protein [Gramella sp. KN1008]|uniref:META domain-containing protein n=1 Tax=Gramella sp. KN1008 TaxID=2529298 RepID=UPI001039C3C9|nr:META domain-containing protein [Gramella sp. KN1008]TBW26563.1 META domain-containing protein [Gramella sp. KN1008]